MVRREVSCSWIMRMSVTSKGKRMNTGRCGDTTFLLLPCPFQVLDAQVQELLAFREEMLSNCVDLQVSCCTSNTRSM